MKRSIWLILALALMVIPICAYAGPDVFSVMGESESKDYTFAADAAVTVQAAFVAGGGTWLKNTSPPKAVTLQPETYGIRIGFQQTPSVDNVGTVITAGSTGRWAGVDTVGNASICNSTAGSNAKVHIIVER
ncbi:hypothetical protein M0Q28_05745 [Patescibacteria group bacterium]|jgi:hypothetical protein|nr:hypothetical protein [Patescibacteria group bacterium]